MKPIPFSLILRKSPIMTDSEVQNEWVVWVGSDDSSEDSMQATLGIFSHRFSVADSEEDNLDVALILVKISRSR